MLLEGVELELGGVALWSVLEGVVLELGGVAFWSVPLVLVLLVDDPVEDPVLLVCANATAHESTRIAMMLSVLFIQYLSLASFFDNASVFNHSTKLRSTGCDGETTQQRDVSEGARAGFVQQLG